MDSSTVTALGFSKSQCLTKHFFFLQHGFIRRWMRSSAAAEVTNGHRPMLLPYKASTCGVKTFLKGPATPHRLINANVSSQL